MDTLKPNYKPNYFQNSCWILYVPIPIICYIVWRYGVHFTQNSTECKFSQNFNYEVKERKERKECKERKERKEHVQQIFSSQNQIKHKVLERGAEKLLRNNIDPCCSCRKCHNDNEDDNDVDPDWWFSAWPVHFTFHSCRSFLTFLICTISTLFYLPTLTSKNIRKWPQKQKIWITHRWFPPLAQKLVITQNVKCISHMWPP